MAHPAEPLHLHIHTGGLPALAYADWENTKTLHHGFFTRMGGASAGLYESLNAGLGSNDRRENVLQNRTRIAAALQVPSARLISCYQIHSPKVVVATAPWAPEENPQADAMVTAEKNLALGILTADCTPVLFYDAAAGCIGAAHAGWKGALGGVIEATVQALQTLGATPATLHAVIGPPIQQQSYEVSAEFYETFMAQSAANQRHFVPSAKTGHHQFNLPTYISEKLQALGLTHIAQTAYDTYAQEAWFYSNRRATHRGEGDYGRMLSAIALV